jgi:hypothetical protein
LDGSIHAAVSKITPVDADEIGLLDSTSSFSLKKLTWANLKATLFNTNNVLIGTTTDNGVDKLQVSGSISDSAIRYISYSYNTNQKIRITINIPLNIGSSGRLEVIKTRGVNTFTNTVFGRQYNETPSASDIYGATVKTIPSNQIILDYADTDGIYDMYTVTGYVTKNLTVTITTI